jgi:hypothetical protein
MIRHHFLIIVLVAVLAFIVAWLVWDGGVSAPDMSGTTPRLEFTKTGNIVHNNPGLNGNAWFLIYEKPGSAGLLAKLSFLDTSKCTFPGKQAVTCAPETLSDGMRVTVVGTQMADTVRVETLTVLADL